MNRILLAAVAAGLAAPLAMPQAAKADPHDRFDKAFEIRAKCDRKLAEARSPWEFQKRAAECNRELAKLSFEQRREAVKEWREREKEWREHHRDYAGPYYRWRDDDDHDHDHD